MPTPSGGYRLNGKRLPSVTTILNRLADQSNLIYAAVKLQRQGIDYKTHWGSSAKIGSAVHAMAESHLDGSPVDDDPKVYGLSVEEYKVALIAFRAFRRWAHQIGFSKPEQEVQLISEEHGFGGTFDCLYRTDNGLILCDWKTSKYKKVDHMLQMAAYGILVEENYGEPVVGFNLLRLDKETADFHQTHWSELNDAKDIFIGVLNIHKKLKSLESRLS